MQVIGKQGENKVSIFHKGFQVSAAKAASKALLNGQSGLSDFKEGPHHAKIEQIYQLSVQRLLQEVASACSIVTVELLGAVSTFVELAAHEKFNTLPQDIASTSTMPIEKAIADPILVMLGTTEAKTFYTVFHGLLLARDHCQSFLACISELMDVIPDSQERSQALESYKDTVEKHANILANEDWIAAAAKLGRMTAFQALLRELAVGETRPALCKKAVVGFSKKGKAPLMVVGNLLKLLQSQSDACDKA